MEDLKVLNQKSRIETYFNLAEELSTSATCPRASVGCIIVLHMEGIVIGGFNGAPHGMKTCNEVGCLDEGGHCVRSVHAEIRAIAYVARRGIKLDGGEAFVTLLPCIQCMQALRLSGVKTIYFDKSYDRPEREQVHRLAESAGVQLIERVRA